MRHISDFYAKLADALSRVTTPFVVMADNDDFFIPQGLTRAVEFLLAHPDHVACGGQCAMFWLGRTSGAQATHLRRPRSTGSAAARFRPTSPTRREQRLRERCLGANDVFYAVHRTDLLRSHFEAVRDCNPRDLFLMEQLVMFLTAIAGKTRQLDTLYIARQQDSPGSSGGAHQDEFGDWYDRMLLPTWSEDFTRFVGLRDRGAGARRRHGRGRGPADRRASAYKMSVAPSLLADLVEEPTVSFSMPMVLQVVRRLVNLPRTSLHARGSRRAGIGARTGCRMTSCTAPSSGPGARVRPLASSRRCATFLTRPARSRLRERPARKRSSGRRCAQTPASLAITSAAWFHENNNARSG